MMKDQEPKRTRRVVTGNADDGKSTILIDEASPHVRPFLIGNGFYVTDLWRTFSTEGDVTGSDATSQPRSSDLDKPHSILRTTQFPPDSSWRPAGVPHPYMHSTSTIDYAIVLEGRIWLEMETSEVELFAGDVVVQQSTMHAWSNRTSEHALVAFVMLSGAV